MSCAGYNCVQEAQGGRGWSGSGGELEGVTLTGVKHAEAWRCAEGAAGVSPRLWLPSSPCPHLCPKFSAVPL